MAGMLPDWLAERLRKKRRREVIEMPGPPGIRPRIRRQRRRPPPSSLG